MSNEQVKLMLNSLLTRKKVRILIEGPPLCGKTEVILEALRNSSFDFEYLTPIDIYSNPIISPAAILERKIACGKILFIDNVDTIFPSNDTDFNFLSRVLSRKPNIIAACRSRTDVHEFFNRYINDFIKMDQPPSKNKATTAPNVTFEDIGGARRAKELVLMMASWCVQNADRVAQWGLTAPSGAILHGPPGTGKTLLAKAASNACNCCFFSISIPDLLRCEVGESEKRLTHIFECARADAPSIIFIDEIQALFGRRHERKTDSNRLVVQLLGQLDLNSKHGMVFCLAATNSIQSVDSALLQPGRFEEIIEISYPDIEERKEILQIALKKIKHSDDISDNLDSLANMLEGRTASEIVGICQKATITAMMEGKRMVSFEEIQKEIQNQIFKQFKTGSLSPNLNKPMNFKL